MKNKLLKYWLKSILAGVVDKDMKKYKKFNKKFDKILKDG